MKDNEAKRSGESVAPPRLDELKQEILDLFAPYGSGNYMPTEEEKEVIDAGLDTILEGLLAPSAVARTDEKPWAYALTQPAGREFDYIVFPERLDAEAAESNEEEGVCEIIPLYPRSASSSIAATSDDKLREIAHKHARHAVAPIGALDAHSRDAMFEAQQIKRAEEVIFYALKDAFGIASATKGTK